MLIVGLTGGIATGKSTVSAMLEKRGAIVIDFDVLSRVVVEEDKQAWKDIVDFFGEEVLNEDRTLDRARIGEIVFGDKVKRDKLQSFIYPRLFEEYARRIKDIGEQDPNAIVIADVPLLIEINLQSMFEKIIVVYATRDQQMQRLTERDNFSNEEAQARLDAQMPVEEKLQHADYVIHNSDTIEKTETEVEEVMKTLRKIVESQS